MEYKEMKYGDHSGGSDCKGCSGCNGFKSNDYGKGYKSSKKCTPKKKSPQKCENRVIIKIDNSCFECKKECKQKRH